MFCNRSNIADRQWNSVSKGGLSNMRKYFNRKSNKPIQNDPEPRKGKVFIATTTGKVVPFQEFKKYVIEDESTSSQLKEETSWAMEEGLSPRPYNPKNFLAMYESQPIYFRTVNQIASDVSGLGWKLVLKKGKTENEVEREAIETFLKNPSDDDSLREICHALIVDWGTTGWHTLELTRNNKNQVNKIYHVPAHTMWVHQDGKKYAQKRGMKKVWFKKYGTEIDISSKTGTSEKIIPGKEKANEIIFTKSYYPLSDHYGIPNILPATGSVLTLLGIRDYNLSFFENYGIPAYLVLLSGEWEEDAQQIIEEHLRTNIKGAEDAHKTVVANLPEGGSIELKKLSVDAKEGSFRILIRILREDILAAYSMPPYRIGLETIGRLGGNVAEEATKVYVSGVVEPLQEDLERIINIKILQDGMGYTTYDFKFNNIDTRDEDAEVERLMSLQEHGDLNANEIRNLLGLGDSYEGGNRYLVNPEFIDWETKDKTEETEDEDEDRRDL